ncbi:MAG: hypothetical protein ABJP34_08850 [Erythrobacter sp.]
MSILHIRLGALLILCTACSDGDSSAHKGHSRETVEFEVEIDPETLGREFLIGAEHPTYNGPILVSADIEKVDHSSWHDIDYVRLNSFGIGEVDIDDVDGSDYAGLSRVTVICAAVSYDKGGASLKGCKVQKFVLKELPSVANARAKRLASEAEAEATAKALEEERSRHIGPAMIVASAIVSEAHNPKAIEFIKVVSGEVGGSQVVCAQFEGTNAFGATVRNSVTVYDERSSEEFDAVCYDEGIFDVTYSANFAAGRAR